MNKILALFCAIMVVMATVWPSENSYGATTLLPNGKQCFANADGVLAAGKVSMYIPDTTSPKQTWQDANQTILNTEPIILDSNGCAIIYGVGSYRQIVYDSRDILIWDQITTDTSANNDVFWAGIAGGTVNAITIVDTGFNSTDGSIIQFIALNSNTGPTTLNPSSYGAIVIQKDTASGPISLTGGEIVAGNVVSVVYNSGTNSFHLLNLIASASTNTSVPLCGATGLLITNDVSTPNTKITVTADRAVLTSTTGTYVSRNSVSVSINFTTTGANGLDTGALASSTWYYVYLIDNGIAPAGVGSLQNDVSSTPTYPAGYAYRCRLGAIRTDGSTNFFRTYQAGQISQYKITTGSNTVLPPLVNSGTLGTWSATSPVLATITVRGAGTNPVPPTATSAFVLTRSTAASSGIMIAPNTNWGGTNNGPSGSNNVIYPISVVTAPGNNSGAWITLEGNTIAGAAADTTDRISILSWKDDVNAQ